MIKKLENPLDVLTKPICFHRKDRGKETYLIGVSKEGRLVRVMQPTWYQWILSYLHLGPLAHVKLQRKDIQDWVEKNWKEIRTTLTSEECFLENADFLENLPKVFSLFQSSISKDLEGSSWKSINFFIQSGLSTKEALNFYRTLINEDKIPDQILNRHVEEFEKGGWSLSSQNRQENWRLYLKEYQNLPLWHRIYLTSHMKHISALVSLGVVSEEEADQIHPYITNVYQIEFGYFTDYWKAMSLNDEIKEVWFLLFQQIKKEEDSTKKAHLLLLITKILKESQPLSPSSFQLLKEPAFLSLIKKSFDQRLKKQGLKYASMDISMEVKKFKELLKISLDYPDDVNFFIDACDKLFDFDLDCSLIDPIRIIKIYMSEKEKLLELLRELKDSNIEDHYCIDFLGSLGLSQFSFLHTNDLSHILDVHLAIVRQSKLLFFNAKINDFYLDDTISFIIHVLIIGETFLVNYPLNEQFLKFLEKFDQLASLKEKIIIFDFLKIYYRNEEEASLCLSLLTHALDDPSLLQACCAEPNSMFCPEPNSVFFINSIQRLVRLTTEQGKSLQDFLKIISRLSPYLTLSGIVTSLERANLNSPYLELICQISENFMSKPENEQKEDALSLVALFSFLSQIAQANHPEQSSELGINPEPLLSIEEKLFHLGSLLNHIKRFRKIPSQELKNEHKKTGEFPTRLFIEFLNEHHQLLDKADGLDTFQQQTKIFIDDLISQGYQAQVQTSKLSKNARK